ncbi:MAG TPA: UbiA family prenyltransferase [Candidatus Baltobacteraceae bacterium]|jgi:4-hydroxybenzoate polyprenyltransferase|nr:UbiA family prenyltransferase [Candidatus Baltobacteraceae bacterium]
MKLFRRPSKLRTLLVLGRVSNLPTVWSDCLAAWWLGGGGDAWTLARISISVSFIYEGGMFLNDAFDASFDRNHRRNRPIPSGAISEKEVWQWGFTWLALGVAGVAGLGTTTLVLALCLSACVLAYNAIHKWTLVAPLLMGACRLGVYVVAASAASNGVDGEAIWKGLALAAYVAGLSWLARKESARVEVNYLPCILLAAPIFMAGCVDDGAWVGPAALFSVALAGWEFWAISRSLRWGGGNVGLTVSRLLAGIALVDLLAVAGENSPWIGLFGLWFALALLLQRFIPAT